MDARRPTFVETIKALTLTHPDYGKLHTEQEADLSEVLRYVEAEHQGSDVPDGSGSSTWGRCSACRVPWPCPEWAWAEREAVIALGRAHNRVTAQLGNHLARPNRPCP